MAEIGNSFDLARLRKQIKPFRLYWFSRLRSTNDQAATMRKRGKLFAPAIVLAGRQIAGRGRNTNTWWSDTGSLTVTFVLPVDDHLLPHQVPLIAGLGVRNAIAQLTDADDIQLKWPNDLFFSRRKLAGLLCERVHNADLIGLGLNVNSAGTIPPQLRGRIVALSEIAQRALDKTDVLIAVVKQLGPMLLRHREHPFAGVLKEYDRHHMLRGRRVAVHSNNGEADITGTCLGLDSMGRLLLRNRGMTQRVIAGQVEMY
ncbi:MAG TPA: biotin--[acetyl-CoA-carboxylase] ligase [Tepidisphaeraceae bacterium]|nr:biotin--[acetyl-CoA-carboxylase] ligase [Tepidisphaeraceae bacterium]